MKDPKEMTDDELYQYLRARKIRLQVAQEISTTYTPQSIVVTSLHNPVYGATKAGITQSSSVTCDYTKVKIEDIIKEMDSRGLDSKKYDDDGEINVVAQKWVRAWKSAKILGTIAGIDLSEVYDVIELCNNMGDIITDFSELAVDISEVASNVANDVDVGEIANYGNEILADVINVSGDAQDVASDIKDIKDSTHDPEIIKAKDSEIIAMLTTSNDNTNTEDSKDTSITDDQVKDASGALIHETTSNSAAIVNLQGMTEKIIQMTNQLKMNEKLKIPDSSFSNNKHNSFASITTGNPIDDSMDSATATKVVV